MANFISRNVLICVVPAVVLLLSVYWFRKKKKIKPEINSPIKRNILPVEKEKLHIYDSTVNLYSPVESTSDFSNTYSDASSISSPESSLRTPSLSNEASTDVVDDDSIASLALSNHFGQIDYNLSISKDAEINSNSQNLSNEKCDSSNILFSNVSSFDCEGKTNDSCVESEENKINLLCNTNSFDKSVENTSDKENDQLNQSNYNGKLHKSNDQIFKVSQPEDMSVFDVSAVNEVIEEPIVATRQNTSAIESVEQIKINHFQNSDQTIESDCHDSHSSVLDENSLSFVSDESEKQNNCKYKDSPSSAFDGNSLSDESEKTDISNEHNTIDIKPDKNCKDSIDCVSNNAESIDSKKSNEQYSIKLSKNSYLVKTILSAGTSSEACNSNFAENVTNFTPSSQHSSVLSNSFQNLSSEDYFISVNKDDLGYIDKQNQSLQLNKEGDLSEDNCNSSIATSITSETVSLDSENAISSTSSFKNCSQIEEQTNEIVNSLNSDIISSTSEVVSEESSKTNGSSQIDSLPYTSTDASSEAVKTPDQQLEPIPDKAADLEVGDIKSSASIPGLYVYEFELPQELCGRLIGRQGKHVKSIKERTNANVFIKRHPFDVNLKTVVVEGSRSSVHEALDIIRRKFPPSQFPTVTLIQTNLISSHGVPLPESLQLHLPEGASCDVILSSLVSAGHFFLQQPTHPTYPSLGTLDQCMITCYTQIDTPLLPQPVEAGVICAAPVMNGWFRAQIIYVYENRTECEIKFVDYGGFSQVPISSLRQIRSDFMTLPFQASECYLANVRPVDRNAGWSSEATAVFEELAQGQILQALLVEYAEDGIPCVHLYRVQGVSSMFINRELVERGLAVWVDNGHWDPH